jgi:hypothetical protein
MTGLELALLGAGIGFLKNEFVDKPQEAEDRERADRITRWSPWTGMKPNPVREANLFNNVLQGGMAGMMFGQNLDAAQAAKDSAALQGGLIDSQTKLAKAQAEALSRQPALGGEADEFSRWWNAKYGGY